MRPPFRSKQEVIINAPLEAVWSFSMDLTKIHDFHPRVFKVDLLAGKALETLWIGHRSRRNPCDDVLRDYTWLRTKELAGATGLDPAASCVTGRRSNQLNYAPAYSASACARQGGAESRVKS